MLQGCHLLVEAWKCWHALTFRPDVIQEKKSLDLYSVLAGKLYKNIINYSVQNAISEYIIISWGSCNKNAWKYLPRSQSAALPRAKLNKWDMLIQQLKQLLL